MQSFSREPQPCPRLLGVHCGWESNPQPLSLQTVLTTVLTLQRAVKNDLDLLGIFGRQSEAAHRCKLVWSRLLGRRSVTPLQSTPLGEERKGGVKLNKKKKSLGDKLRRVQS